MSEPINNNELGTYSTSYVEDLKAKVTELCALLLSNKLVLDDYERRVVQEALKLIPEVEQSNG